MHYTIIKLLLDRTYVEYTTKTPEEKTALPTDTSNYWSVLMDKGYIGPETDTPNIQRD